MGRFHGWPEQAYDVLLQLGGEPSMQTRENVRREREQQVRQPMIDLLNDLADADPYYQDFSVWRYATMAYMWQNQSAIVRVGRNIEIAFRFNLDGLLVQGSWWYAGAEQIASYRRAVAEPETGSQLQELLGALSAQGYQIRGDTLRRVPRGFPPDHPRAGLLRHRSLLVARELEADGPVLSVEPVHRCCEQLRPLLDWFVRQLVTA